jgi:hypothetical protein
MQELQPATPQEAFSAKLAPVGAPLAEFSENQPQPFLAQPGDRLLGFELACYFSTRTA